MKYDVQEKDISKGSLKIKNVSNDEITKLCFSGLSDLKYIDLKKFPNLSVFTMDYCHNARSIVLPPSITKIFIGKCDSLEEINKE